MNAKHRLYLLPSLNGDHLAALNSYENIAQALHLQQETETKEGKNEDINADDIY